MTMLLRGGATGAGSQLPTGAATGQVLQWNGSAWVAATPSASGTTPNATTTAPGLVQLAGDLAGTAAAPTVPGLAGKANASALAAVATSGAYTDLTSRPALSTVATSGAYTDLTSRPALSTVATSGSYGDLTGRPLLAPVATSGQYADLTGTPAGPVASMKQVTTGATSTVTLALDPELQVTAPVGWYLVQLYLIAGFANTSTNGGLQGFLKAGTAAFGVLGPASYTYSGNGGAGGSVNSWIPSGAATLVTTSAAVAQGSVTSTFAIRVTTAGTLGFTWAQAASSTITTSLLPGSALLLTKCAA